MINMTPEQCQIFCGAAAAGIAMELDHRYEWFVNANRMLMHGHYDEVLPQEIKILDAFMAFEKCTASCPEEKEWFNKATGTDYCERVGSWYREQGRNTRD